MAKKTLLIKSNKGAAPQYTNKWEPLTTATAFIDDIDTSDGNTNASAEKFNLLISGVPSPWARVKLTSYALSKTIHPEDTRTLMLCYKYMKDEWRGLMAAYALKPDRFVLSDPIPLNPVEIADRRGKFDILSTYAEMLFDDAPLWQYEFGKNSLPYMQLLYYKEKTEQDKNESRVLVGATSPYSIFFTATNYALRRSKNEIPWIEESGKFSDPASIDNRGKVDEKDLLKLYSFLSNIDARRKNFEDQMLKICGDEKYDEIQNIISCLSTEINAWKEEIQDALKKEVVSEVPVIIKDQIKPDGPLRILLSTEYSYFWKNNAFYTEDQGDDTVQIDNIGDLFIEGTTIVGWKASNDPARDYEKAPVYYMKAQDEVGDIYYFALPFSKLALSFLDVSLEELINGSHNNIKLQARKQANKLVVILSAKINNEEVDILYREFDIIEPESNGKVFIWPNFISPIWKNYYYYSEYPTNDVGIRIIPEFEKADPNDPDFEELLKNKERKTELDKLFLVRYPVNQVSTSHHRYEIIKTETPLKSLSINIKQGERESMAGCIILKKKKDAPGKEPNALLNLTDKSTPQKKATIGIDFGSNNTCVYYKATGEQSRPVPFKNRRLALIGFDNLSRAQAHKDELFFISNEEPINENGQIKSWLHEHESSYIGDENRDAEITGGVPVNEANILVRSMDENIIKTNAGTLNYNMKWLSGKEGEKKKEAFIKMIWIQICADLFANGIVPEELKWSFPSAMSNNDVTGLNRIYSKLAETPIKGVVIPKKNIQSFTESEAVCSYSLSQNEGLTANKLFLGIDIGGSTSDILILGREKTETGVGLKLFSQCSLRMAAGFFFKAINNSAKFRTSLYNFHKSQRTSVKVLHIEDILDGDPTIYQRSPYYLNNIFDQLKGDGEFTKFYDYLQKDVAFVFSLPAYVTGLLVYYSGMLLRKTITDNKMESVNEIHLRYYGKGGRLFEWLFKTYETETQNYLRKCFKAGLRMDDQIKKIIFDNQMEENDNKMENKSEVAKGLVDMDGKQIGGIYEHTTEEGKIRRMDYFEIVGEKGIAYYQNGKEKILDEQDIIENQLFENALNFEFPEHFENFNTFIDLFINFIHSIKAVTDIEDLKKGKKRVSNVGAFMITDPEYLKFQKDIQNTDNNEENQASYRMPILIASALYYLDNVLMPAVFKKEN